VSVRQATPADQGSLHALYGEFFAESPPPAYLGLALEDELAEVDEIVEQELAFVAEGDDGLVGFALARRKRGTLGELTDLYVIPRARRRGVATELMSAVIEALRERGTTHVVLSVQPSNTGALAVYDRWGFGELSRWLVAGLDALGRERADERPSFGSVHVQTDDSGAVVRAVRQFVPRLPGGSSGSVVSPPRNGWVAVYDELCDREPPLLGRLARELSDRMGAVVLAIGIEQGKVVRYALLERGRIVDEYVSVPEYFGPIAPGDVVALGANATVVARLTGADPKQVRSIARTAASPTELPPAPELLAEIAGAMRIEGTQHGYAQAREIPGAEEVAPP
jgi:ribosomal protein S18 acetylase RimI-like enzyme